MPFSPLADEAPDISADFIFIPGDIPNFTCPPCPMQHGP